MGILVGFAPFILFALVERTVGPAEGLFAGAIVSALILLRDLMARGHAPKVLDIGSTVLFGGLAAYAPISHAQWSLLGVRLSVDLGLLMIVLASIALRRPFTLQYARERVSPDIWHSPTFIRTNYVITWVWAAAFLAMVVSDAIMLYLPEIPHEVGILTTIAALVGAIKFTGFYPAYVRRTASTTGAAA